MHLVEFKADSRQQAGLRMRAHYAPDVPYLVPDKLAQALKSFAGLKWARPYTPAHSWANRQQSSRPNGIPVHKERRSLIYTIGGLGDYLALLPALVTEQHSRSLVQIDICTEQIGYELLCCGGFRGKLIEYPLRLSIAERYDALLLIDDVTEHPRFKEWDLVDVFADFLDVQPPLIQATIRAGKVSRRKMSLTDGGRKRIGVQLHGSSLLRSFPHHALMELLRELVRAGYEVHMFGESGACEVESSSPLINNWCGKTGSIEDLVALVEQMDLILAPDSFLAHLGGVMGKPTLAVFTTVPSRLRTRYYPSVTALEPFIGCNPCFGRSTCPAGHDHCLVWDEAAVSPRELVKRVARKLGDLAFDSHRTALCNRLHD